MNTLIIIFNNLKTLFRLPLYFVHNQFKLRLISHAEVPLEREDSKVLPGWSFFPAELDYFLR